jgi:eukaryotic-like serine/threonine-protein kinase
MSREFLKTLRLPFDSVKTLYEGPSEVRLYRNQITGVLQIGKRIGAFGLEEATVFREAQLLQSIRHDNVVPVYDVAVVDDPSDKSGMKVIEMIMPYYPRGSVLDALVDGATFSVGAAVQLVRDLLTGLSVLHDRHGLLHRDMKSPNVFLDDRDRARVGDLGASVPMRPDGTAEALASQQIYTAPEVHTTKVCDRRTDLYGVGIVFLELLNGPLPYANYTPPLIWRKLSRGFRPISPRQLQCLPHVPPRLRQVVACAVATKPSDRFSNARAMMDALDQAPFIDWTCTENSKDRRVFEGSSSSLGGRPYRITIERGRRGQWKLVGQTCVTQWRRCVDDQVVDEALGVGTTAFFDQVVKQACS